jgi:hypothetical protein
MLTKNQCGHMSEAELARAERALRVEIPRAQGVLAEIRRELKKRRKTNNQSIAGGHHGERA